MRKPIFIKIISFLMLQAVSAQVPSTEGIKYSPNGYFENVFDHYGNSYQLKNILAGVDVKVGKKTTSSKLLDCDSGIFELYFEDDWYGTTATVAQQEARKTVICKVFHDLSEFIETPLKYGGNTTKVKIWVRNIDNLTDVPTNVLGLATSFYTMPYNTATNFGGIIDNEIWKTITLGSDSFINVVSPFSNTNSSQNSSGNFYHGMMAFSFNDFIWNTDLSISSPTGQYDLYSVVLHEVTHALGLASLMDENGQSVFGNGYNYFSRYDALLKNNVGSQKLLTNTNACSSMYDYVFNSSLSTSILHPNPNGSSCVNDQTACSDAIKFVGTTLPIPVYTPNCFQDGSSLSHFEDQCISVNQGNNTYFTMSNVISNGNPPNSVNTKRFLKPEERNALSDVGYRLNNWYGDTSVANNYILYGGNTTSGIDVAGANDGRDSSNNLFIFSGNVNETINLTNLLTNDVNAVSFECMQDVFDTSALIPTSSGSNSTPIIFSSAVEGLHLLRYVPVSSSGQKGNISYVYVYVYENNSCSPSSCDLVSNGDFETLTVPNQLPTHLGGHDGNNINYACGWHTINNSTPDYFHANSNNPVSQIPCNYNGFEEDNVLGNNAYASMILRTGFQHPAIPSPYYESIRTTLNSPLIPNTTYQLSFDLSLADKFAANAYRIQAYLSTTITPIAGYGGITNYNTNMFRTYGSFSTQTDGWQKIVFTFTTGEIAGERFLYLGGLDNTPYLSNANPVISSIPGCFAGNNLNSNNSKNGTYYIDNVSLISLNGGSFDLPNQLCNNAVITNLGSYLMTIDSSGVFTGDGVSLNNGIYSFNATIAGVGNHTITYTYTNSNSCEVEIYANIEVLPANDPSCNSNPCPSDLTLSTPEVNPTIVYKTDNWIKANSNYEVDGENVTMKAGDYIVFETDAHLKAGSEVTALIEICEGTQTTKMITNDSQQVKKTENNFSEEFDINQLKIYPNPLSGNVLNFNAPSTIKMYVHVFDILGNEVVKGQIVNNSLNIGNLNTGVYIVKVTIADKIINKKLIIK